jgi:hypothetical protein
MVYLQGSLGPACLGYELHSFLSDCSIPIKDLYLSLGLERGDNPRTLESLFVDGLSDGVIRDEVMKAKNLSETEVQPIITTLGITPERTFKRIQLALNIGIKAVHLFGFSSKTLENFSALKSV